ncbi:hypothetical protein HA402_011609 [Bradysia odoriphaga]|nr:hypothetical protein HA402_011609 [Bradysia odoriphaga]
MSLKAIKLLVLDEEATLHLRYSLLKKWTDEVPQISLNDDERLSETEDVSILNLPSLKRGNMKSKSPSDKLKLILEDKQRLNSWIENYKVQFKKTDEKDLLKTATFREAATRLKMLLDHSDFDEGDYRIARRKAITEINEMLGDISGL